MFRPFLNSLMLGSLFFLLLPLQEAARKGRDPFLWPNCGTGM